MEISSSLTLTLSSSAKPIPLLSPPISSFHSTFFITGSLFNRSNFKTSSLVLSKRRTKTQNPKRGFSCNALFGLGVPELIVIAGVAALVFGPKKLPEVGRSIGKTVKSFQQAAKEFESELKKDPNSETALPVENSTAVNVEAKQEDKVPSSKESI